MVSIYAYENINEITSEYIMVSIIVIMGVQLICTILVNRYIKSKESSTIAENEVTFDNIKEDKKAYVKEWLGVAFIKEINEILKGINPSKKNDDINLLNIIKKFSELIE